MIPIRTVLVLFACLAPSLALAATPKLYGGAFDPITGGIALTVAGVALWTSRRSRA